MTIPAWILDIFAAAMLAVPAVSAARLAARRPWQRSRGAAVADIDAADLLMGIAMAGTLRASGLRTLPDGALAVIFGAHRVVRRPGRSQCPPGGPPRAVRRSVRAAPGPQRRAMLYMFAAVAAPGSGERLRRGRHERHGRLEGKPQTLYLPVLAFAFALLPIGYCVWDLDPLSGPGLPGHYSVAAPRASQARPALAGVPVAASAAASLAAATGPADPPAATPPPQRPAAAAQQAPSSTYEVTGVAASPVLTPWVTTSCRIAMGVTMAFILIIMIKRNRELEHGHRRRRGLQSAFLAGGAMVGPAPPCAGRAAGQSISRAGEVQVGTAEHSSGYAPPEAVTDPSSRRQLARLRAYGRQADDRSCTERGPRVTAQRCRRSHTVGDVPVRDEAAVTDPRPRAVESTATRNRRFGSRLPR